MTAPTRLFLIGYRGTGKSTVGRLIAAALGWEFLDADDRIEGLAGKSVADIFATEGEAGFRDLESAVLAELCQQDQRVIATGGGVVQRPFNRELLSTAGYVAWLTASPETIWQRMQSDPATTARRPNLTTGGLDEVVNLLAVREPLYRQVAHGTFPTEGQPATAVADAVLAAWRPLMSPSAPL